MTIKAVESDNLNMHVNLMLNINKKILSSMHNLGVEDEFAFNDTGDGCLCVFWDKHHAVTSLKIAIDVYQYLQQIIESEGEEYTKKIKMDTLSFGMGLHSANCSIGNITLKDDVNHIVRNYIYGTVANSVARLEGFTKNYIHDNFLMSADFKEEAINQYDKNRTEGQTLRSYLKDLSCLGEVDLKDHKEGGHWIFSLGQVTADEVLNLFGLHRHQKEVK